MTNYQATPFCGERNEDPGIFLRWFLQCMGTADDNAKARHFVYYLQADSDADEWFEDLEDEEKKSWAEVLFRKRWLKYEEISTKEEATSENKPQPVSITSNFDLDTKSNTQNTPKVNTEPNKPQDVTAASPTTTMAPLEPKPLPILEMAQNLRLDASKRPQVTPKPLSTPQATSYHPNLSQAAATSLLTTVTESWPLPHQKASLRAETPQKPLEKLSEGTQGIPKLTNFLNFEENQPISCNTSPSSPHFPPNEPISPQPPPNTSMTTPTP
jgi:hypothetical protein